MIIKCLHWEVKFHPCSTSSFIVLAYSTDRKNVRFEKGTGYFRGGGRLSSKPWYIWSKQVFVTQFVFLKVRQVFTTKASCLTLAWRRGNWLLTWMSTFAWAAANQKASAGSEAMMLRAKRMCSFGKKASIKYFAPCSPIMMFLCNSYFIYIGFQATNADIRPVQREGQGAVPWTDLWRHQCGRYPLGQDTSPGTGDIAFWLITHIAFARQQALLPFPATLATPRCGKTRTSVHELALFHTLLSILPTSL